MKKVLITGISGFIGSRMATFLAQRQLRVFGWNRIGIHDEYGSTEVNMHQENDVIKALENCNPDIIIHCAGSADVGKSVVNPTIDFEGNVKITHNLMFAMHKLGLEKTRFVFLSSAGVYGNPVSLPISEDAPLNPLSPYAVHKVMCEDLCKYFTNNYGTNVKVARIFSAYGAGLKKQIFWDMFQKYKNTGKLNMFGTGNESRDYIHVDDLVQALYLLAMTDDSEVFYNVANGEEITIREATEQFANSIGAEKEVISFNGVIREGDPLNWRADISRILRLGYQKKVSIQDGLDNYVQWVRSQDLINDGTLPKEI